MQVCLSKAEGGLELSTLKCARFFRDQGYNSVTLCLAGSFLEKKLIENRLDHISVDRRDYFSFKIIKALWAAQYQYKFSAAFVHQTRDLWHTFWLKKKNPSIKIFGYLRMFLYGVDKKDFLHKMIYGQLDKMLVLSEAQIPTALECLPITREKIQILPNGIDLEKFRPYDRQSSEIQSLRREFGVTAADQKLVGLIGRLDFQKGHREFVLAAKLLRTEFPGARFLVIGSGTEGQTDFENEIKATIAKENLDSIFCLQKFRNDIPQVMSALDIFVLASYNEAFGNVLLEAMACKTPCVGTKVGGVPELLGNGEYGILVKSESGEALAQGIAKVLSNYTQFKSVAEKAYQRVLSVYDAKIVYKKLEELLR